MSAVVELSGIRPGGVLQDGASALAFTLSVTGSHWRVLSREITDIFSF